MASTKKSTLTYDGNPGYVFQLPSGPVELNPGDTVDATADEAASLGDEFTKSAPAADSEGGPA